MSRRDLIGAPLVETVVRRIAVLTIDLPYIGIGWGAGHLTDLLRVTRTRDEPLRPVGDPLVIA